MQNLTFCGNILDFSAHGKWRAIIENQTPLSNCPRPTLDKADGASILALGKNFVGFNQ